MIIDTGMVTAADSAITEHPVAHMKAIYTSTHLELSNAGPTVVVLADLLTSIVNR
jgi:hypothetical protein